MFSSSMEVDCSLEDFARVLVANGYMNDDSCFTDGDLPSMLSAFESSDVLGSPDNFPDSPYSNGDLPRTLEMAEIVNPNLLESCLSNNSALAKNITRDYSPCKSQEFCLINPFFNEHLNTIATSLSHKESICSKDVALDNCAISQPVSLNFSFFDNKDSLRDTRFQTNIPQLPHSAVNHVGSLSYQPKPQYQNQPSYRPNPENQSKSHYQIESLYQENQTCEIPILKDPEDQELVQSCSSSGIAGDTTSPILSQPTSSTEKQKRRRRRKGYSKAAKSKRRKNKDVNEIQHQSKPKKRRVTKNNLEQDRIDEEVSKAFSHTGYATQEESGDVPHEDSGFESGDKNVCETSTSVKQEASDEISVKIDTNKCLRRSSRTTRTPENYNLRLSSLVKRVETERRQQEPRPPKDKIKPAPLSKYRRRTANARERDRMKEINDAFDMLKSSLPTIQRDDGKQKITKFTILKHALNYIASLRDTLGLETVSCCHDDDAGSDFSSVQPGSVASFGGEDSCSSSSSSHSTSNQPMSAYIQPSAFLSEPGLERESFPQPASPSSCL